MKWPGIQSGCHVLIRTGVCDWLIVTFEFDYRSYRKLYLTFEEQTDKPDQARLKHRTLNGGLTSS